MFRITLKYFSLQLCTAVLMFNYAEMVLTTEIVAEPTVKSDISIPAGALYLPAEHSHTAVILFHSRNDHPDSNINRYLRQQINYQLGYHTLALKLPRENIAWYEYEKFVPDVMDMTQQAIQFLNQQKKVTHIYFLGRGMGARFATAYLGFNEPELVVGLVGVTMRNRGTGSLNTTANIMAMSRQIPVLDIFGNAGKVKYEAHADERLMLLGKRPHYAQVSIPNAGSAFKQHQEELMHIISRWFLARTNQVYDYTSAHPD